MVARNGQSSAFTSLASKLIEERWVYLGLAVYNVQCQCLEACEQDDQDEDEVEC